MNTVLNMTDKMASLPAAAGRRRNSRALAVSIQSLSCFRTPAKSAKAPASSAQSYQRSLELIAKDEDFGPVEPEAHNQTSEFLSQVSPELIVREGRRKEKAPGHVESRFSDAEDALSSAGTPPLSETNLLRCVRTGQVFYLSPGMKVNQLHESTVLPVLENRLYFQTGTRAPDAQHGMHYFTWDSATIRYFPLCADFGPFNLGMTHHFCQVLLGLLSEPKLFRSKLVLYTSPDENDVTNAIYLLGSFLCLHLGASVEEAWEPFSNIAVHPCAPYRDASWVSPSTYDINVTDCWGALLKAVKMGLYDPAEFTMEEYLYYDAPANGDMHEVVPGKFLAFKGPTEERRAVGNGVMTFLPTDYCAVFEVKGVRTVVRLCDKDYDREWLVHQGYHHVELPVPECAVPTDAVVDKFLRIAEGTTAPIAMHCQSGLGPTPTLIGMYMMKHLDFSADEAIAWLRICRPGSIVGPQQHYLEEQEGHVRALGVTLLPGLGLDSSDLSEAEAVVDREALELAEMLLTGVKARDQAKIKSASLALDARPVSVNSKHTSGSPSVSPLPAPKNGRGLPPEPESAVAVSVAQSDCRRASRRPSSALLPEAENSDPPPRTNLNPESNPTDSDDRDRPSVNLQGPARCQCKEQGRMSCTCKLNLKSARGRLSMMRQWNSDPTIAPTTNHQRHADSNFKLQGGLPVSPTSEISTPGQPQAPVRALAGNSTVWASGGNFNLNLRASGPSALMQSLCVTAGPPIASPDATNLRASHGGPAVVTRGTGSAGAEAGQLEPLRGDDDPGSCGTGTRSQGPKTGDFKLKATGTIGSSCVDSDPTRSAAAARRLQVQLDSARASLKMPVTRTRLPELKPGGLSVVRASNLKAGGNELPALPTSGGTVAESRKLKGPGTRTEPRQAGQPEQSSKPWGWLPGPGRS